MHPLVSYHGGHSGEFCDHGKQCTLEEVVNEYVKNSFTHFGVSEHQPMVNELLYPDEIELGHDQDFLYDRFDRYVKEAKRLQDLHSDSVQFLVGFETEWCGDNPQARIESLRSSYDFDYIVGSVHHVKDIPIDFSKEVYDQALHHLGSLENLYCQYYDHQLELIESVRPDVLGHFDLVRLFSPDFEPTPPVQEHEDRNIKAAIKHGVVFDLNCAAYRKGLSDPYPSSRIIEKVVTQGGLFTPGDDSHGPVDVGAELGQGLHTLSRYTDCIAIFERDRHGKVNKTTIKL